MILLDTCAYLYAAHAPERLSPRARRVLASRENVLVWSVASTWEIVVKAKKGLFDFPEAVLENLDAGLAHLDVRLLPIEQAHTRRLFALPDIHRDPFDRILLAQAAVEGLAILTSDRTIPTYPGVSVVW